MVKRSDDHFPLALTPSVSEAVPPKPSDPRKFVSSHLSSFSNIPYQISRASILSSSSSPFTGSVGYLLHKSSIVKIKSSSIDFMLFQEEKFLKSLPKSWILNLIFFFSPVFIWMQMLSRPLLEGLWYIWGDILQLIRWIHPYIFPIEYWH